MGDLSGVLDEARELGASDELLSLIERVAGDEFREGLDFGFDDGYQEGLDECDCG